MMRLLRSLRRDQRGASIIELALVLPVFSALVVGVVDISRAYSQKLLLEQAAYRAIEKVQQYQSTKSTYNTLQDEVTAAAADAGHDRRWDQEFLGCVYKHHDRLLARVQWRPARERNPRQRL